MKHIYCVILFLVALITLNFEYVNLSFIVISILFVLMLRFKYKYDQGDYDDKNNDKP